MLIKKYKVSDSRRDDGIAQQLKLLLWPPIPYWDAPFKYQLLHIQSSFLLMYLAKQQKLAQVLWHQTLTWEAQIEYLAPDLALDKP